MTLLPSTGPIVIGTQITYTINVTNQSDVFADQRDADGHAPGEP